MSKTKVAEKRTTAQGDSRGFEYSAAVAELQALSRQFEALADASVNGVRPNSLEIMSLEARAGAVMIGYRIGGSTSRELRQAVDATLARMPGFPSPDVIGLCTIFDKVMALARSQYPEFMQLAAPPLPTRGVDGLPDDTEMHPVRMRCRLRHSASACRMLALEINGSDPRNWSSPATLKELGKFFGMEYRAAKAWLLQTARLRRVPGRNPWQYRVDLVSTPPKSSP